MQRKVLKKESELSTEEAGDSAPGSLCLLNFRRSYSPICLKVQRALSVPSEEGAQFLARLQRFCENLPLISKLSLYGNYLQDIGQLV